MPDRNKIICHCVAPSIQLKQLVYTPHRPCNLIESAETNFEI